MTVRLRVPAVDDPDFVADIDYLDGAVLRLAGSADSAAARELAALFDQLHGELIARGVRELIVDLRELEQLAPAGVTELVAWFGRLAELAPSQRYAVRLRANPAIGWQTHAVPALSCFDPGVVAVER